MTRGLPRCDAALAAQYQDVRALVLGASGFIGAWVTAMLSAHGAAVHGVARQPDRAAAALERLGAKPANLLTANLEEPGAITRVIRSVRPAVVFNAAGYGVDPSERDPEAMTILNTDLVREITSALTHQPRAAWAGAELVQIGSALEYGQVGGRLSEDVTPRPTTAYGQTKLLATNHVRSWSQTTGRRAVVVRLFNVYGPGEHPERLFPSLCREARRGGQLDLTGGSQRRDFAYVEDVAEGLLRVAVSETGRGELVNLGSGHATSVRTFTEEIARVLGLAPRSLRFGALPDREEEMWHGEVDIARLQGLTGWAPATSLADAIRRSEEFADVE